MGKGVDVTKFEKKLAPRRKAGECCCWDCLRASGLTPPLALRGEHRGLGKSKPLYDHDVGGEPQTHSPGQDEDQVGSSPEESQHLREAVANRDVI